MGARAGAVWLVSHCRLGLAPSCLWQPHLGRGTWVSGMRLAHVRMKAQGLQKSQVIVMAVPCPRLTQPPNLSGLPVVPSERRDCPQPALLSSLMPWFSALAPAPRKPECLRPAPLTHNLWRWSPAWGQLQATLCFPEPAGVGGRFLSPTPVPGPWRASGCCPCSSSTFPGCNLFLKALQSSRGQTRMARSPVSQSLQ